MKATLDILSKLGEPKPVPMGDNLLYTDMQNMNRTINEINDESILGMKKADQKRIVTLMKVSNNIHDFAYRAYFSNGVTSIIKDLCQFGEHSPFCETIPHRVSES